MSAGYAAYLNKTRTKNSVAVAQPVLSPQDPIAKTTNPRSSEIIFYTKNYNITIKFLYLIALLAETSGRARLSALKPNHSDGSSSILDRSRAPKANRHAI